MRRAFTLVELLIVIIVIAVLAAIVVPRFSDSSLRSREASLKATLRELRAAVARFKSDTDLHPLDLADLAVEVAPKFGLNSKGTPEKLTPGQFEGPYVSVVALDPISGNPFLYAGGGPKMFVGAREVGDVRSSAAGRSLDGSPYSSW